MFELVPELAEKTHILDLKFCSLLLEDNALYPWVILVPKVPNAKNMHDLCMEDRLQFMREISLCEEVLAENFSFEYTNVAILGNCYAQLHAHVVCHKENSKKFGVFEVSSSKSYSDEDKKTVIAKIKRAIMIKQTDPKYLQGMHKPDYSSFE